MEDRRAGRTRGRKLEDDSTQKRWTESQISHGGLESEGDWRTEGLDDGV